MKAKAEKIKRKNKGKRTGRLRKRWPLLVGSLVLLLWSLLPLVNGIHGVGVLVPGAAALLGIGIALFAPAKKTERKRWQKGMTAVFITGVCLVAATAVTFSGLMIASAAKAPEEGATVIVLGSKIYGSRPSRMLRARLDVAADYLEAHPASNCVVSGGLGKGETYTEAEVMKNYLVNDRGIAADRIACEDTSTDTHENTAFSLTVIEEKGWSRDVAIATQVFHQYRAGVNARWAGADSVGGIACFSPPHLMLNYWVRECAAICRLWLLRY
ncbi:MAG: YdcF family protein [Clostridia bacterium]|nr:YdcF family protein [Clostridia bacterium]